MSALAQVEEFQTVMDRAFALMSADPVVGPRLRDANTPQRLEFTDLGLVLNVRPGAETEANLEWAWGDEPAWEPRVRLAMSSAVAIRYFQGRESIAVGIARGQIRATGDVRAALALVCITKPLLTRYRELVAAEYPHLAA